MQVANRRLFYLVREERQLTYDAHFSLDSTDSQPGGVFQVGVTSTPEKIQSAIRACKESLLSLKTHVDISLESAKHTLLENTRNEAKSLSFWVHRLAGLRLANKPVEVMDSLSPWEEMVRAVTREDLLLAIDAFGFDEDRMTSCVGISSPEIDDEEGA